MLYTGVHGHAKTNPGPHRHIWRHGAGWKDAEDDDLFLLCCMVFVDK